MPNAMCFLVIGLIAGTIGALFIRGRGFGPIGDIIVGVTGAEFGGWLFVLLGLTAYGGGGALGTATIGAVALLAAVKVIRRA